MMCFFTDLGFTFPPFSFVGWSRGWTAEDMDKNVLQFKRSEYISRSCRELADNSIEMLRLIKKLDMQKMVAPKPHSRDSLSSGVENPGMNI